MDIMLYKNDTSYAMFSFSQDFGDSIPGHGGITDRMDCQVSCDRFEFLKRVVHLVVLRGFILLDWSTRGRE